MSLDLTQEETIDSTEEKKTPKSVKSKISPKEETVEIKEEQYLDNKQIIAIDGILYEIIQNDELMTWHDSITNSVNLNAVLPTKETLLMILSSKEKWIKEGWYWSSTLSDREVWIQNYIDSKRKSVPKSDKCKSIYLKQI
jgi:hypothetical protein